MAFQAPTLADLRQVAAELKLKLSETELADFLSLMGGAFDAYAAIDAMPDFLPPVKYKREAGYRPTGDENKYGAWYVKAKIKGAESGPLSGRTVVLKDNISLAGVPMAGGTAILEGFVPSVDATVVTRVLDAGGEIVGKAVCENFSTSGGSHTSATGPVHNPRKPNKDIARADLPRGAPHWWPLAKWKWP
jgi:amidase